MPLSIRSTSLSLLEYCFLVATIVLDNSFVTQIPTLPHQLYYRFCWVTGDAFGWRERQSKGEGEGFNDELNYDVCHIIWSDVQVEVMLLTTPPMQLLNVSIQMWAKAHVDSSTHHSKHLRCNHVNMLRH